MHGFVGSDVIATEKSTHKQQVERDRQVFDNGRKEVAGLVTVQEDTPPGQNQYILSDTTTILKVTGTIIVGL